MKLKIVFLVLLFLLANFAHTQVKFRVKKLNADSLVGLLFEKHGTEHVEVLNLLSNVICRKDLDSSLHLAVEAIELSEELKYQKGLADGYFNLGNVYFLLDSLQPTISNYLKALRIYEDLEPTEEFGNLCMQLGMINYYTGRSMENNYGRKALHLYESIFDRAGQAMLNHGTGSTNLIEKDYDSAAYYYNKALTFLDPAKDQTEAAYLYKEMGTVYDYKFYESSDTTYFYKSAYWYNKGLKLPAIADEVRAWNYLGLGELYLFTDSDSSISRGKEYLNKVIQLADSCFDAYDFKAHVYYLLAWRSYIDENFKQAIFYSNQAINITEERSDVAVNDYKEPILGYNWKYYNKVIKQVSYKRMFYIYSDYGDYKKALEYNILSQEAEEDIYKEKNKNLVTMLESVSEDEKTDKQMAMLAKDNELKALTIKQSRTYLFALVGFILVLVLMALLFFRQRKIRAEHKTFVREQKLMHDLELKNMESEKLKELDQLKSRFFANISHEFRTPLTLIKGPLEKLLSKTEDSNDKKELGIAKKYAGKLQILINNLLTISKLESGKMKLFASETDVVKLVQTYIQSFESLAKQKNIGLNFKSENKDIRAYIDREKFEQVLNNLLSNAFKFTGEGGVVQVTVTPPTPLSVRSPSDKGGQRGVIISISDTGHGIPPEHIDHIFDRFYQVGQENNNYYEGTGIGLALTKELVELHHGTIKVESEFGQGSIFTICLLLGKDHLKTDEIDNSQHMGLEPETFDLEPETFPKGCLRQNLEPRTQNSEPETNIDIPLLLIVEDNSDMRTYIRGYFENEFHVVEAVDGADGYEKSTENIPDIIISDVMMPNMDGNEFCSKVKADERTSHIPVILLTARVSKESRMEGLETGADDFITKPFDGDELQVRVNNLIDQRKRLRAVLERKIQKSQSKSKLDFEDIEITSMDDTFLQKAKGVAENNLSNPEYTIEDFASAMALSRSQLHRKLKALINSSGTDFINTIRMNYAIELLQKKAGTISEIAYDAGFNNPNYFSKIFRRKFGVSPSEYQNNIE